MSMEKRALSWAEFMESGFDDRNYRFPDFEGTFDATIAGKRWGKSKCLIVYLDLADGRKIMTSAWNERNYLGLADMPLNSPVTVTFVRSQKGAVYLRRAEQTKGAGEVVLS